MGVDCRYWVIPRDRGFWPGSEQIAGLVNALRLGSWVPSPDAPGQRSEIVELLPGGDSTTKKATRIHPFGDDAITTSAIEDLRQNELLVEWRIHEMRAAGVQYPFAFDPYPEQSNPYFDVQLLLGPDYFCWTGETVMPFDPEATTCSCGKQLAFETGWGRMSSSRIHRICPECAREFNPSDIECDVVDGWNGEVSRLKGGVCFGFALIVNCHKYFPAEEEPGRRFQLRQEFTLLWDANIGVRRDVVVTFD